MGLETVMATQVETRAPTSWTTFATRSKASAATLSRLISSSQRPSGSSRKRSGHCTATTSKRPCALAGYPSAKALAMPPPTHADARTPSNR